MHQHQLRYTCHTNLPMTNNQLLEVSRYLDLLGSTLPIRMEGQLTPWHEYHVTQDQLWND